MKKALLVSLFIFFSALAVLAYETVIIKFPDGEIWERVYYKQFGGETILQYVPKGQFRNNWKRTIVIHAYEGANYPVTVFMANNVALMFKNNPTAQYKYLKIDERDCITGRCTKDYKGIKSQCEFFRASRAHGGIISIHYINKDQEEFMRDYKHWYDIIKKAKFLNTYWRNNRILNKSEYFELW